MATKRTSARPPGRGKPPPVNAKPTTGQGAKYALVRSVLKTEPLPWILERRSAAYERPDGRKGPMSFRELSEDITRRLHRAGHNEFITIESVARWCRLAARG